MKRRQGRGFLRFMFFMAIFFVIGAIVVILLGGNLTVRDEDEEPHSVLDSFYGCIFIIFATLLVAIISNFYLFSCVCLILTIFMNIVFIGKINFFAVAATWGIEMLFFVGFSGIIYTCQKSHRVGFIDELKHIPDGYKIMSKAARKEWIDFLSSINPHGEDEEE